MTRGVPVLRLRSATAGAASCPAKQTPLDGALNEQDARNKILNYGTIAAASFCRGDQAALAFRHVHCRRTTRALGFDLDHGDIWPAR